MNTDDRGEYRLFWLAPGRYYIAAIPQDLRSKNAPQTIVPPGTPGPLRESFTQAPLMHRSLSNSEVIEEIYELVYHGGGIDERRAQAVELAPGASRNAVDISLAEGNVRARRIRGVVVDGATGRPAASTDREGKPVYASVRAIPLNPGPSTVGPVAAAAANGSFETAGGPLSTATLENGTFQFPRVPPGRYRLIAVRAGYPQSEYGQRRPGGEGLPITLAAGQQMNGVQLFMAPGAAISGRVTGRNGRPVARADVQAVKVSHPEGRTVLNPVQSALTNDLGEYRLFWMPPGQYYVSVRPISSQTFGGTVVINPNGTDSGFTFLIDVHAGEEIRDVNVTAAVARTVRIRGTVFDPATLRSAPANTRVFLTPLIPPSSTSSAALVENAFQFGGNLPGLYEIRAQVPGTTRVGRVMIEVRDRDVDVAAPLLGFDISGRVVVEGLAAGLQVSLRSAPAFQIAGPVSADGAFRLEDVPPGDYQVYVSPLEDGYVTSIRMGEADLLTRDLHIDAQPADRLQIVVGRDGGAIDGRVFNDRRQAVPNATVALIPDSIGAPRLDRYKTASTGPSGEFQLRGIAPGAYIVFAWEDVEKDAWFDPNFIRLYRDSGRRVHIVEGANESIEMRAVP